METEITINIIKRDVGQILQGSHPNSAEFKAGVILLSSAVVGPDLEAISGFTGYSTKRGIIQRVLGFIHEGHLLTPDGKLNVEWDTEDPQTNTVTMLCDIMVATGQFSRKPDAQGEYAYSLTDAGKATMPMDVSGRDTSKENT
jgi:hypothetical protein